MSFADLGETERRKGPTQSPPKMSAAITIPEV